MNVHKPHMARQAKRQKRQPGNLQQLLGIMWHALSEAEAILVATEEDQAELKLKDVHAIIQAGRAYAKLLEVGELEARLSALEQAQRGQAA